MSLTKLVHSITSRATDRQAQAAEQYAELLSDLAAGNERAPEEVEEILEATGKSTVELEREVARIERRRDLAAKLREPDPDNLQAIGEERRKAEQAHEKATADYRAKLEALRVREAAWRRRTEQAEQMRRELLEISDSVGEIPQLKQRMNQSVQAMQSATDEARRIEAAELDPAKRRLADAERSRTTDSVELYTRAVQSAESRIRELKEEASRQWGEQVNLQRRIEQLEAAAVQP